MRMDYSTNWNNKLQCDCYSTLRLSGRFPVGQVLEVYLKKEYHHHARVQAVYKTSLDKLTDYACHLDTGYNAEETRTILKRMYGQLTEEQWAKQALYVYILKRLKPGQI